MTRTVVILGSRANIVRAAVDLGVHVLWIRPPGAGPVEGFTGPVDMRECDLADYAGVRSLVLKASRSTEVCGVFSLTEGGLLATARLNAELGLPGNRPKAVEALLNKGRMRAVMAEACLPEVRHRLVRDPGELIAFMAETAGPLILKPPSDTGSRNVFRICEVADAVAAFATVGPVPMLAEELLVGREISVEAFSADGVHRVIAFTDKSFLAEDSFIEIGHTMPAVLGAAERTAVARAVADLLTAVEVDHGPTHTEVVLTAAGPRVIESHTRVGGAGIAELVRLAHGVDLARLTVGVPLGLARPPAAFPDAIGGAASRAVLPAPGVVTAVRVPDDLPPMVSVALDCRVGQVIPPLLSGNDKKAGVVIASGVNATEAATIAEAAVAQITVRTESR
ncbi:biotin carboxylase [Saccharothrix ecbatanensis]|uniref:Biotin carboxylase n=1 Tax=Saccharothrix ecbatanensis TaxID=1105145 RepID=A0A7W9HJ87_9PSEU|nr:ATP-grasp domain-containing protein [Saccharothrix ecbatanensis]MBB5803135.1 biotin carboxylase [Saccharothrix ecbatanensis]